MLDDTKVCSETYERAYYCQNAVLEGTSMKIIDAVTPAAHAWAAVGRFSEDAIKAFKQDVAQQTEALLYQAHRLQLQPLISRLHTFIAS
jgi:hypothetical protein